MDDPAWRDSVRAARAPGYARARAGARLPAVQTPRRAVSAPTVSSPDRARVADELRAMVGPRDRALAGRDRSARCSARRAHPLYWFPTSGLDRGQPGGPAVRAGVRRSTCSRWGAAPPTIRRRAPPLRRRRTARAGARRSPSADAPLEARLMAILKPASPPRGAESCSRGRGRRVTVASRRLQTSAPRAPPPPRPPSVPTQDVAPDSGAHAS
jgi:hypothetical protein